MINLNLFQYKKIIVALNAVGKVLLQCLTENRIAMMFFITGMSMFEKYRALTNVSFLLSRDKKRGGGGGDGFGGGGGGGGGGWWVVVGSGGGGGCGVVVTQRMNFLLFNVHWNV